MGGGPYNKHCTILGSISRTRYLWKPPAQHPKSCLVGGSAINGPLGLQFCSNLGDLVFKAFKKVCGRGGWGKVIILSSPVTP